MCAYIRCCVVLILYFCLCESSNMSICAFRFRSRCHAATSISRIISQKPNNQFLEWIAFDIRNDAEKKCSFQWQLFAWSRISCKHNIMWNKYCTDLYFTGTYIRNEKQYRDHRSEWPGEDLNTDFGSELDDDDDDDDDEVDDFCSSFAASFFTGIRRTNFLAPFASML